MIKTLKERAEEIRIMQGDVDLGEQWYTNINHFHYKKRKLEKAIPEMVKLIADQQEKILNQEIELNDLDDTISLMAGKALDQKEKIQDQQERIEELEGKSDKGEYETGCFF